MDNVTEENAIVSPAVEPEVNQVEPVVNQVEPEVELAVEPVVEPEVELAVEPVVEPVVEPEVEPAVEPVVEPVVEPEVGAVSVLDNVVNNLNKLSLHKQKMNSIIHQRKKRTFVKQYRNVSFKLFNKMVL
ncbi:hypothetical protein 162313473 [Organic Lake phycodnavirus 1]|nr:hypothetical protein 162313473 [Organic Lake phycodnavirus 1]